MDIALKFRFSANGWLKFEDTACVIIFEDPAVPWFVSGGYEQIGVFGTAERYAGDFFDIEVNFFIDSHVTNM